MKKNKRMLVLIGIWTGTLLLILLTVFVIIYSKERNSENALSVSPSVSISTSEASLESLSQISESSFVSSMKIVSTIPSSKPANSENENVGKMMLYTYDLNTFLQEEMKNNSVHAYDYQLLAAALQGLANRQKPQVFYYYFTNRISEAKGIQTEKYWLEKLQAKDEIFTKYKLVKADSVKELLIKMKAYYKGVVVWDSNVPATSMVASTICGCDDLLPVRYDISEGSPYQLLVNELKLPVKVNLVGKFTGAGMIPDINQASTGSTKNDAYLWAKGMYLDKAKTSSEYMYYNMDSYTHDLTGKKLIYTNLYNCAVINYDYYIAKKAFFFDLMPSANYIPNDDKTQKLGTDYTTMNQLLKSQYDRSKGELFTVGGFVPWQWKYSEAVNTSLPNAVDMEWWMIEIFSQYNGMNDGDALGYIASANHSVYMHVPLNSNLKQLNNKNEVRTNKQVADTQYICFYMGDYDSAAWVNNVMATNWDSVGRGKMPLAWQINGNLARRAPHVYNYLYKTMSKNDYFVAGDNGGAYLNPMMLLSENRTNGLPSALDKWVTYNQAIFNQFDLDIEGFLIAGHPNVAIKQVLEAYSKFATKGIGVGGGTAEVNIANGVPVIELSHAGMDNDSLQAITDNIYNRLKNNQKLSFFRAIIVDPETLYQAVQIIHTKHPDLKFEVVDPYTLFSYMK